MQSRKRNRSKHKKRDKKSPNDLVTLKLFCTDVEKNALTDSFKSIHEINKIYGLTEQYIYEAVLHQSVKLGHSLDPARLKILISDAEQLNHTSLDFFVDSFERLRLASEDIPLPHQIQWLANWAIFLLFNADKSPKYNDLDSDGFKQFISCLRENYDNQDLPLSLRARFALLIAYSYILPALSNSNCESFEINPRVTRCPIQLLPKNIQVNHDDYRLQMHLFWLNEVIKLPNNHKMDILNLQADCKDLIREINTHFWPRVFYSTLTHIGQAFFAAANRYQSTVYPTAPDMESAVTMKK